MVLDSRLRLPLDSQLINTLAFGPVLVVGCGGADTKAKKALEGKGVRVVLLPRAGRGVSVPDLLAFLGKEGLDSLFVEGGGQVAASFIEADAVDRIEWFRAPLILGEDGRAAIAGADAVNLKDVRRWRREQVRELDSDLWETYVRG
jgi:diaminohydroxyphosphoribosylaminopyrimidine deaminase/5-amino-6-(5-phosphoribosylamino)uracil reductase